MQTNFVIKININKNTLYLDQIHLTKKNNFKIPINLKQNNTLTNIRHFVINCISEKNACKFPNNCKYQHKVRE